MDPEKSAQIARIAATLSGRDHDDLRRAGATILNLLAAVEGGDHIDDGRLARIRERATAAASDPERELRIAGRTVLLLLDELESSSRLGAVRSKKLVFAGSMAVAAVALAVGGRELLAPPLHVSGPKGGTVLGLASVGGARFAARETDVSWQLDGRDVTADARQPGGLVVSGLADGEHRLRVQSKTGFLWSRSVRTITFAIDRVPPSARLEKPARAVARGPLDVSGRIDEPGTVTINGRAAALDGDTFAMHFARAPDSLRFVAVDRAGNRAVRMVRVDVTPRRPRTAVHAVHVSAYGWSDDKLRTGVLQLIAQRRIDAVELDLKDESGIAGFGPALPIARRAGASRAIYDLPRVVKFLHSEGVRVIGRLVCFRDPMLAGWAWTHSHRDWVIQTPTGGRYSGYGGFTNFANEQVRRYQIAIAVAAARAGVDDILYDYVRRPDGPLATMRFPGLRASPSDANVQFLRESRTALSPYHTYLGASVFGVAATRPSEVAQPIRRMAAELDYVAPMVYPSHWSHGEYGVADPERQPYQIVRRSLRDFSADVHGTGARVVPWLQDFSLGVTYGPAQVRAQIAAATSDGIHEFLLWDPDVLYTASALEPRGRPRR